MKHPKIYLQVFLVLVTGITLVAIPLATMAQTEVSLDAPETVAIGSNITVNVSASNVTNFDAGQFDVIFDPTKASLIDVTSGTIGGTEIPIAAYAQLSPGHWRIVVNIPGAPGITGNGTLATVSFNSTAMVPGESCVVTIENGYLNNNEAQEIPSEWSGCSITAYIVGDATGDGVVNTSDVTKIERIILLMDPATPGADVNSDDHVNTSDITLCERIILGYD